MTTTTPAVLEHGERPAGGLIRHCNIVTAIVGGVVVAALAGVLTHLLADSSGPYFTDRVGAVTFFGWDLGFLIGIGAFNAPVGWFLGRDLTDDDQLYMAGKDQGRSRYWKFCTDHKVVGIQYLIMAMIILFAGGVLAMLIRTELMRPGQHFVNQQTYNTLIGMHGILMIVGLIILVTGPFGNFVMPIMIGARDMAFPRLNALSFWLLVAAVGPLLSVFALGGISDGWSTYAPLAVQAHLGMDAFAIGVITFVFSTTIAGVNIVDDVRHDADQGHEARAGPDLHLGRHHLERAWPLCHALLRRGSRALAHRPDARAPPSTSPSAAAAAGCGRTSSGSWATPRSTSSCSRRRRPFSRSPPSSPASRSSATRWRSGAMVAIAALSIMVWAHHMFTTGWAPALNGPFMLTTEIISIPTGIIFLCRSRDGVEGQPLDAVADVLRDLFLWNFIIGGLTGIYLSDVPADNQFHGSMFVTAHFHYILVGAVLLGGLGAVAYWFPKITGRFLDEKFGKVAFWVIVLGIQVTFLAMFWDRSPGHAATGGQLRQNDRGGQLHGDDRRLCADARVAA